MTVCGAVSSLFKSGYPPLVKIPNYILNLIKAKTSAFSFTSKRLAMLNLKPE